MFAISQVVDNGIQPRKFLVYTDSEVNIKPYAKGRDKRLSSVDDDLWTNIFNLIDAKSLSLELQFVPSHLDDAKKREKGYTTCDFAVHNNIVADHVAETTAEQVCLPPGITAKVLCYHKLVKSIQLRLYAILLVVI